MIQLQLKVGGGQGFTSYGLLEFQVRWVPRFEWVSVALEWGSDEDDDQLVTVGHRRNIGGYIDSDGWRLGPFRVALVRMPKQTIEQQMASIEAYLEERRRLRDQPVARYVSWDTIEP